MPVLLRALSSEDTEQVHALISDIRVVQDMLIPLATDVEHSRAFVEASSADTETYITRAITIKEDGSLVGLCGLAIQHDYEAGEIWYLLDPECWGRGIALEAVVELLRIAFADLELHRVWATCCPENPASANVLAKAGMRLEGRHVRNLLIQGQWRDSNEYAILEDEWRATLGARPRALGA
jgi:RimJ/RimL family protein N-acetyltransferase